MLPESAVLGLMDGCLLNEKWRYNVSQLRELGTRLVHVASNSLGNLNAIMAFKLPSIKPRAVDCSGLPIFDLKLFTNKEEIGKGGYGAVFTADWPGNGNAQAEKLVVKKMLGEDITDKKNFVKEARMLKNLNHTNIVKFKGICSNPFALILEYVFFDFTPFGMETRVSSLADFLGTLDSFDCKDFDSPHVFSTICEDVAKGLKFLHDKDIAHRDLKDANILVSNQHYCDLDARDIQTAWEQCPVICKLADFGESRSRVIQTNTVLQSQTSRVNRGTPVYMAPEILVGATRLAVATTEDFKRADIWALGMSLFVLLNPCSKYPYFQEVQDALSRGQTALEALENLFHARKAPTEPLKYQEKHATDWYTIQGILHKCIRFDPEARPNIDDVIAMVNQTPSVSSLQMHLKVAPPV